MAEPLAAYLVKGDDAVLRSEAVRALVTELVGDGDASLVVEDHTADPDDQEGSAAAVADAAQTPPFLTDRRVVVARDVGAWSTDALEPILRYLADPLPSTSLVLVAGGGGPMSRKLTPAVKAVGHVVDAGVPANRKGRGAWLDQHLKDAPVRLERAAVDLLDRHLGEDLGRLSSLLDALAAAYGAGARVTADDVEPFMGEAGSVPPWDLTDAIDGGDTQKAIATLHRMLEAGGRHPLQLMAVLHGHYARILRLDGAGIADEAAAAQALGIKGSTFPAKKALTQARRLGTEGVAEAIDLLARADLDLRGTKGWPDGLVMEVLVARLSRLGARSRR
ncbi:MAG TPA: DNA polymerase III subunit delta [Acidimicrobiales bacterium]|nr:DNA polymerase III subunit delta [Acidimicrobiales bacterium]